MIVGVFNPVLKVQFELFVSGICSAALTLVLKILPRVNNGIIIIIKGEERAEGKKLLLSLSTPSPFNVKCPQIYPKGRPA